MTTPARALPGLARAPFLLLALVAWAIGAAAACWLPGTVHGGHALLALLAAVLAHTAVNSLNEYHDFRSGLDLHTTRTPFSGGSGVLPRQPQWAPLALGLGLVTLLASGLIGLYLLQAGGPAALVLGLLGVALVVTYTPWLNRNPWLCLLAPGVGFGPVIVAGTGVVLTGGLDPRLLVASLPMLFLASNLLLLNQLPDREADAGAGRRHLPIVIGARGSLYVFGGFLLAAYASLLLGWAGGLLPVGALAGLATLPLGIVVWRGAWRHHADVARLTPVLGQNVLLVLGTGGLLAAGLFLSA